MAAGVVLAALTVGYGGMTAPGASAAQSRPNGVDVASYQRGFDWETAARQGISFAYAKATEGTSHRNPLFAEQYNGSYRAGMIRGAYHYARRPWAGS
jgi:GH25 family lysozyme M1 (1,4-beta-N-acetylmuramidase)